jgi:hypothetical protein
LFLSTNPWFKWSLLSNACHLHLMWQWW